MVSEAKEGWEGGEVLFAGGTDWAKVAFHLDMDANALAIETPQVVTHGCALCRLLGAEAARNKVIKKSL